MTDSFLDDIDKITDLKLSVGLQGRKNKNNVRPLRPFEVAQYIQLLKNETNENDKQISRRLGLGLKKSTSGKILEDIDNDDRDDTQVKNFLKLLKFSEKSVPGIGYKGDGNMVPFSVAAVLHKLNSEEQDIMINNIIEHKFNRDDVRAILNYKNDNDISIQDSIQKFKKLKVTKIVEYQLYYLIDQEVGRKIKQFGKTLDEITIRLMSNIEKRIGIKPEKVAMMDKILGIYLSKPANDKFKKIMTDNKMTYNQCMEYLVIGD